MILNNFIDFAPCSGFEFESVIASRPIKTTGIKSLNGRDIKRIFKPWNVTGNKSLNGRDIHFQNQGYLWIRL